MDEDDQNYINSWVRTYINMGYLSKSALYDQINELLVEEDGELTQSAMDDYDLNEDDAIQLVEQHIRAAIDTMWAARFLEQQTWDITLAEKLTAAFEDLKKNHAFVYAMNTGEDVPGLRSLLVRSPTAMAGIATAYVGFHEQALENAVDEGSAPYLIYGPTHQPVKKFLESKTVYTKRQDALYQQVAQTISDALTRHNIKHVLNNEMLYIDEPWQKKLDA